MTNKKNSYPLPNIDIVFDTIFSDIFTYLHKESREIETLATGKSFYKPLKMTFGLTTSPAIFQSLMNLRCYYDVIVTYDCVI